ncbi:MAG TPA: cysteine peptidase family C39 domain-containing protein, partial [Allocoleopsis sp.]
ANYPSVFSEQEISDQLTHVLGQPLSDPDLAQCLQTIEFVEPAVGKLFWRSTHAVPGIYLVLAGKVRLLRENDDLITSLEAGQSFGELTLFPNATFQAYAARASLQLRLAFIPGSSLQDLIRQHPQIREHLYQQAIRWNERLTEPDRTNTSTGIEQRETKVVARRRKWRDETDDRSSLTSSRTDNHPASNKKSTKKKTQSIYFPRPTVKAGQWWQQMTQRYPAYHQQSASDCGAACLVMIGQYWGKRFSVNRLRDFANVDRNGSSLRGLAAAAESIGFSTYPIKADLKSLTKQRLPAIAHWEGKHFIVVYKITRDRVIVADPAIGQRSLTHAAFNAGWTGYALLLLPNA